MYLTFRILLFSLVFLYSTALTAQNTKESVDEYNRRAFKLIRSDRDSCLSLLTRSARVAMNIEYKLGLAVSKNILGRYYMLAGEDIKAHNNFQAALELYEDSEASELYSKYAIFRNLAAIFSRNHDYETAIDYYDLALLALKDYIYENPKESRKNGSYAGLIDIPYFKARTLKRSGDFDGAGKILIELWDKADKSGDTKLYQKVLNQIGLIKSDLGEFEEARSFYHEVLSLEEGSEVYQANALHSIAVSYLSENQLDLAENYFRSAIRISSKLVEENNRTSDQRLLFINYLDLGETFYKQDDYSGAIAQWHKALDVYDDLEGRPELFVIHDWLEQAYKYVDIERSNAHGILYRDYNERFNQTRTGIADENTKRMFDLQVSGYVQKKAMEAAQRSQVAKYRVYLLLISALILTGAILTGRFLHRRRKNRLYRKLYKIATDER